MGVASDGSEAMQKAKDLPLDLVLLDLEFPILNRIQVARRQRGLLPRANVLFLSVESSSDVVREALSLGALGYVYQLRLASQFPACYLNRFSWETLFGQRSCSLRRCDRSRFTPMARNAHLL